ncbi:tellurite resistance TerB family protein [Loktanella sp. M215]|uniref:tellurite resistance TerB family protein n=1 Tax=Loktanella sp. M215 TaxID=2675431 RepID=UPI001F28ED8E|nr:TerB family tellurite resistance protein [Loktanella sp. M215]MCF7697930.1 TerB family tellurite resistance protein [Loktanella sp. M215]
MFADLLRRMAAPAPDRMPDADARLALGALLVRLARADGRYEPIEKQRIEAVLCHRYGLTDAADLRQQCEELESQAPDTVRFTRAIKDAVDYDHRLSVIEAMWQIVLADGERDAQEDSIMRMVAPMLGVTDQDSNAIRRRIEAQA